MLVDSRSGLPSASRLEPRRAGLLKQRRRPRRIRRSVLEPEPRDLPELGASPRSALGACVVEGLRRPRFVAVRADPFELHARQIHAGRRLAESRAAASTADGDALFVGAAQARLAHESAHRAASSRSFMASGVEDRPRFQRFAAHPRPIEERHPELEAGIAGRASVSAQTRREVARGAHGHGSVFAGGFLHRGDGAAGFGVAVLFTDHVERDEGAPATAQRRRFFLEVFAQRCASGAAELARGDEEIEGGRPIRLHAVAEPQRLADGFCTILVAELGRLLLRVRGLRFVAEARR